MKIIVSHVYSSDNKGDAALASVLLDDIKRQYKTADVTVLTFEKFTEPTYEGAQQMNSFMYHALTRYDNKTIKLFYTIYVMLSTLLWAFFYRTLHWDSPLPRHLRAIAKEYAKADLVITVGGGYIRTGTSLVSSINLLLSLHPLVFGKQLNKPTVIYTQSIGPFQRRFEERLAARVLRTMNLIILREEISKKLLRRLGVTKNVVRSVDSGFLFASKKPYGLRKKLHLSKSDFLVGVTVRKWLDKASQTRYETSMAHAVDYLTQKHDAHVVFIPQVTAEFHGDDDRKASQDVYRHLAHKDKVTVITDNTSHYDIKAMYDELDLIVGTRFHSVIFSLTSRVPALAIEYEHKTSGIMNDLQLSQWVVKIEATEPALLEAKIDELIAARADYTAHLDTVLPEYIASAKQAIVLTDQAYKKATDAA